MADQPGEEEAVVPEPVRVIYVRVPESLHKLAKARAHEQQVSLNTLMQNILLAGLAGHGDP